MNFQSLRSIRTEEGEITREVSFSLRGSVELLSDDPEEQAELEALDPIERLREFFSPERTAERIAKFAVVGYEGADTEEGRRAYAEEIGEAIARGIQEARDLLGELPDETAAEIDETESLVEQRLEDFVKLGGPALEGSAKDRVLAYRASLSLQIERSTTVTLYNATGAERTPPQVASFAAVA